MPIESMNECLNGRLVQMPDVGRRLPRFLSQHHRLGRNEAEGVDDYFPLDALDWVDHYCHCPRIQSFKTLCGMS